MSEKINPSGQRIGLNEDGSLDEIWIENVNVHIEQMSNKSWFVGIYRGDDNLMIDFGSKRKITATIYENDIELPIVNSDQQYRRVELARQILHDEEARENEMQQRIATAIEAAKEDHGR